MVECRIYRRLNAHFTAKGAAVACLQLFVDWLLGVDGLWLLAFDLAVNDSRSLGYSNVDLGGQRCLELFTCNVPLCPLKIRSRIKRPDQPFFDLSSPSTWKISCTMLFAFHLGFRPMISDAAATAIQKIGLARIASMTGKVVLPSLAPQFQLNQADIMIHNLVFNVTKLSLNHLLVAEYVVQFGWDGVAQVKDASASTANSKDNDASQCFLADAAPKPWLWFRG